MVKFDAPEHTQGPLAGWSVQGRWTTIKRDPQWRGDVGYEEYVFAHHWEPAGSSDGPWGALRRAVQVWCDEWWPDWRVPDHVEVDAVYASHLSPAGGSQDDPFQDITGTQGGHDGYLAKRRKGA